MISVSDMYHLYLDSLMWLETYSELVTSDIVISSSWNVFIFFDLGTYMEYPGLG